MDKVHKKERKKETGGKEKEKTGTDLSSPSGKSHPRLLGSKLEAELNYVLFFCVASCLPRHSLFTLLALQEMGAAPQLHAQF